ncbi:hypothetical protein [Crossiella sp. CA198]|uniref:hypothetical protein n=1 Tax=Crossiella sp. CA198 TaxID=3455607 RepID=UPI003F8D8BD4
MSRSILTLILATAVMAVAFTDLAPPLAPLATFALALLALGYVAACRWFPLRRCPACKGSGHITGGLLGGIRYCGLCRGEGIQLRRGVVLWRRLRRGRGRR